MYEITKARSDDADEILALYGTVLGGPAGWNEEYPCADNVETDIRRGALFVMKNVQGEIIGAISEETEPEVEVFGCWDKNLFPAVGLSRLCVRKDMQNRGLSKKLIGFAFDHFAEKGAKGVHILVRPEHVIALASYKKLGFREAGRGKVYGIDFILMERAL